MGVRGFVGPGAGFGIGTGCGFGIGYGFGGGPVGFGGLGAGGGCGVGIGLGWGYGAAMGSKYIVITPEFEREQKTPKWLKQVQQAFAGLKFGAGAQKQ